MADQHHLKLLPSPLPQTSGKAQRVPSLVWHFIQEQLQTLRRDYIEGADKIRPRITAFSSLSVPCLAVQPSLALREVHGVWSYQPDGFDYARARGGCSPLREPRLPI